METIDNIEVFKSNVIMSKPNVKSKSNVKIERCTHKKNEDTKNRRGK